MFIFQDIRKRIGMPKKNLETLEKLVIRLLVTIQEIKLKQENVNRGQSLEEAGGDELFNSSHEREDFLELIFLKSGGDGVDFC